MLEGLGDDNNIISAKIEEISVDAFIISSKIKSFFSDLFF